MIAVKINCDCGQHYAFDIEPVDDRMDTPVACPACGTDGTPAANEAIAQQLGPPPPSPFDEEPVILIPPPQPKAARPPPPVAPPATPALKINKTEAAPVPEPRKIAVSDRELGIVSREQAETEARAKISWGESQQEVTNYLLLQRFTPQEARELVTEMFAERIATVRANGMRKIIGGSLLICVPVATLIFFLCIGVILLKIMAVAVMVGLWGVWQVINGIIALAAPKMESGDVAEQ